MTFNKSDNGKPRFGLVPPKAEMEVVQVLTHGGDKYGDENWRNCDNWDRYLDALGRHLNAYRQGQKLDAESRLHHLAHAICCALFLLEKDIESDEDVPEARLLPPWQCKDCG